MRITKDEIHSAVNQSIINDIWKAFYQGFINYEQLEFEIKSQSDQYQKKFGFEEKELKEKQTIELLDLEV